MFSRIRRTVRELRSQTSGNATLLLALGMPAFSTVGNMPSTVKLVA